MSGTLRNAALAAIVTASLVSAQSLQPKAGPQKRDVLKGIASSDRCIEATNV